MERRRIRAAGAVAALVALAYLVALGATGFGAGDTTGRFVSVDTDQVFGVVSVVLGAVVVWVFYELLVNRRMAVRRVGNHERFRPWHLVVAALIAVSVLMVFRELNPSLLDSAPPTTVATGEVTVIDGAGDGEQVPDSRPGWHLWTAAAAGVVALFGLVAAATVMRRRPTTPEDAAPVPRVHAPVADAVGPGPPDAPDERIFAAYRRVEAAAIRAGVERPEGETVRAHLRRVGGGIGAVAAGRLAGVYDGARFSTQVPAAADAEKAERAGDDLIERLR